MTAYQLFQFAPSRAEMFAALKAPQVYRTPAESGNDYIGRRADKSASFNSFDNSFFKQFRPGLRDTEAVGGSESLVIGTNEVTL